MATTWTGTPFTVVYHSKFTVSYSGSGLTSDPANWTFTNRYDWMTADPPRINDALPATAAVSGWGPWLLDSIAYEGNGKLTSNVAFKSGTLVTNVIPFFDRIPWPHMDLASGTLGYGIVYALTSESPALGGSIGAGMFVNFGVDSGGNYSFTAASNGTTLAVAPNRVSGGFGRMPIISNLVFGRNSRYNEDRQGLPGFVDYAALPTTGSINIEMSLTINITKRQMGLTERTDRAFTSNINDTAISCEASASHDVITMAYVGKNDGWLYLVNNQAGKQTGWSSKNVVWRPLYSESASGTDTIYSAKKLGFSYAQNQTSLLRWVRENVSGFATFLLSDTSRNGLKQAGMGGMGIIDGTTYPDMHVFVQTGHVTAWLKSSTTVLLHYLADPLSSDNGVGSAFSCTLGKKGRHGGVWTGRKLVIGWMNTSDNNIYFRWSEKPFDSATWNTTNQVNTGFTGSLVGLVRLTNGCILGLRWDALVGGSPSYGYRAIRSFDEGKTWEYAAAADISTSLIPTNANFPVCLCAIQSKAIICWYDAVNDLPKLISSEDCGKTWS